MDRRQHPDSDSNTTAAAPGAGTVLKRLAPGVPGTRRLQERFGDELVCVRYRDDPGRRRRLTTVELIVDVRPRVPREAFVRVAYGETELRRKIRQAGGEWDAGRKLWRLPRQAVHALNLACRVVTEGA